MSAGTWTFTNAGRKMLLDGTFDIDSDSFKVALFQSTSNIGAASTTYAGLTNEVANNPTTTGYTTGGIATALALSGTTTEAVTFVSNPVWSVVSANLVARFAVLYEVGGNVLCYCLLDSTPADVTTTPGNTLTIDSDGTPSPVFTLT